MDNADLEKLTLSAGALCPAFHKDKTEYTVSLASGVASVKLTVLTSDSGASYQLKVGGKRTSDKTVAVAEGCTVEVVVCICSEDGSGKKDYTISVSRLSANDASLASLTLSSGELSPEFSPAVAEYCAMLPAVCSEVTVTGGVADSKMALDVQGGGEGSSLVALNAGQTTVKVVVTSANGCKTASYSVCVQRGHWGFPAAATPWASECPICLGVMHCPVTTETSRKQAYCHACIAEMTRTRKQDFVTQESLTGDRINADAEAERVVSDLKVDCPKCGEGQALRMAPGHLAKCDKEVLLEESCGGCSCKILQMDSVHHKKYICSSKQDTPPFSHTVSKLGWEKTLQSRNLTASNIEDLLKEGKEFEELYKSSVPDKGQSMQFEVGMSPVDYLEKAAVCYASVNRIASQQNATGHFRLGLVQEELYYLKDTYHFKESETGESDENAAAEASSIEEEFLAICQLHGVSSDAPLAKQLKAVEAEYLSLKEQKNQQKAEHVQMLYSWMSSQAAKGGKVRMQAADKDSPLGRAFCKYCDALKCDASDPVYNLHVGKMLLQQGKLDDAIQRLQSAVAKRPTAAAAARFFLGVSLLLADRTDRQEEAIAYVAGGLSDMQRRTWRGQETTLPLNVENVLQTYHPLILQGLASLAQAHCKRKETSAACSVSRSLGRLAVQGMVWCPHNRSDVHRQFSWSLIDAHACLLEANLSANKEGKSQLAERCGRLIALMRSCGIPSTDSLLVSMQLKTCQQAVKLQPGNGQALCALGEAQLSQFDLVSGDDDGPASTSAAFLRDAQLSFRASIGVEGRPVATHDISKHIEDQAWWKSAAKPQLAVADNKSTSAGQKPTQPASKAGGATAQKAAAPRTGAAARGASAAATGRAGARAAAPPTTHSSSHAGSGAAKPGAASSRAPATTAARGAKAPVSSARTTAPPPARTGATTKAPASRGAPAARGARAASTATATTATRPGAVRSGAQAAAPVKKPGTQAAPVRGAPVKSAAAPGAAKAPQPGSATSKTPSTPAAKMAPPAAGSKETSEAVARRSDATEAEPDTKEVNTFSHHSRLGLARVLAKLKDDASIAEARDLYGSVISKVPSEHDAYIELASMIVDKDAMAAVDIYCKFPFRSRQTEQQQADGDEGFDDAYIHGEVVRLLMKNEKFDDERLESNMIAVGRLMSLSYLDNYSKKLEVKFKYKLLMNVYAGVNRKPVDDPDLQAFFKVKCWK